MVLAVDMWLYWLGGVGVQHHGVTLTLTIDLGCARTFSTGILQIYLSDHKDIWITATDYYIFFHLIVLSPLTAVLQLIILLR